MNYKIYCSDCQVEARIIDIENPWDEDEETEPVRCCFYCGSDGISYKEISEE